MHEITGLTPSTSPVPTSFHEIWGDEITAPPKTRAEQYVIGDDGLLVEDVGPWVKRKHAKITDFVHASAYARRKYSACTFIDVFSGPGRSILRDNGEYVDGSAVAAYKAGLRSAAAFSSIEISDARPDLLETSRQRLTKLGAPVRTATGPAKLAIKEIIGRVNPAGLHFALLDPHNLGALSFDLFEELNKLDYIDVLVHLSIADLQRNSDLYAGSGRDELDEFDPGWRKRVGVDMNKSAFRAALVEDWMAQLRRIGLPVAGHRELISGSQSQRLYWLVFLSRHPLAHKLWTAVSSAGKQPAML